MGPQHTPDHAAASYQPLAGDIFDACVRASQDVSRQQVIRFGCNFSPQILRPKHGRSQYESRPSYHALTARIRSNIAEPKRKGFETVCLGQFHVQGGGEGVKAELQCYIERLARPHQGISQRTTDEASNQTTPPIHSKDEGRTHRRRFHRHCTGITSW